MTKRGLDQYKGRLTADQIAAGINAAARNANRLLDDAKLLLKSSRFPSAASLAALAIEESGKASILRGLALARDDHELNERWREYRSHAKKNVAWILPELAAQGARSLDDFRQLFDEDSDHPYVLDQVKQLGFYTDCLGEAHWSVPDQVVDESLARGLVRTAEIMARDREITAAEIELWIKHLAPVWGVSPAWMKQALINWYKDAHARGLVLGDENAMDKFVRGDES